MKEVGTDNGAPYLAWRFRGGFLEEADFQKGPKGLSEVSQTKRLGRMLQVEGTADAEAQR